MLTLKNYKKESPELELQADSHQSLTLKSDDK